MKKTFLTLSLLFVSALPGFAAAADVEAKSVWARGTVPAQMMSGVFMELGSKGGGTLVGASTPVAEEAEVHEMRLEGGVMKMRAAPRLALPAGKTVTLKPGGYHIMLMGLKQQLKAGDSIPVTLTIEGPDKKVESVTVNAEVRALNDVGGSGHDHQHMH